MMKYLCKYLTFVFLIISIAACNKPSEINAIDVTDILLDRATIELVEGEETTLIATVIPDNATNKAFTWDSSNSDVASVSDGKVTALRAGNATITVTTEDGDKSATCEVTVNAKVYPVTSVSLDKTSATLTEGEDITLIATVTPDNATNKEVTWTSSDDTVASVTDGKVTAQRAGNATITVTTEDGGKTATCEVIVNAKVYPVTSVSLDKTSVTLTEGEDITLIATVTPDNATNKEVTWTSSDDTVASVTDGKVTAQRAGNATITVTTEDGGKTATCEVTVKAKVYHVTSVSLDKTSATLTEGEDITLIATVTPDNATNKEVTWTSSDDTVASVTDGKVTAQGAGNATITVTTQDSGKTATCEVTVKAKVYHVTSVSLDKTSVTLTEGEKITLAATVTPDNATNKQVTWTSSDNTVAAVTDGKVTALKPGTATITVTAQDGGKTATCEVTVKAKVYPVTSISLDMTKITLTEGEDFTLTATVNPYNATNKNVTWKSSNNEVAAISDGKVTALKPGTATITVTTEDGGKTATCEVTVKAKVYHVTSVSLDKTSATLTEGEEITLTATVTPDNATNKEVTWRSSNNNIASVINGKVTALKPGTATITVTTQDGGKTATCEVIVNAKVYPVTSVSLDKTSATLTEGDEITLTATVTPDNATNKKVSWTSSDNTVAAVTDGKVTALKPGTATITVTTEDGGKTATCELTLKAKVYPVTSVSLDKTSATLTEGDEITLTATVTPDNATNKKVSWTSSDNTVAAVTDGKVTALKPGTATITVTTEDGGKTATCEVTVKAKQSYNQNEQVGEVEGQW